MVEAEVEDGPADVVLATADVTCALATGRAEEGRAVLGLLDAALARWAAAEQGTLSLRAVGAAGPCVGLPEVEEVALPGGGWAVGLKRPAARATTDGPGLARMGEDGRWWHVTPWTGPGTGAVVFEHEKGPPTRLLARMNPQAEPPAGVAAQVPLHGVGVLELDARATYAAVVGGATLVPVGQRLLVLGGEAGPAAGVLREGDGTPRSLRVVVGAPLPPRDDDLVVRAGGRKWVRPDRDVVEAWSAAPGVVAVELRDRRILLHGGEPGRAQVALVGPAGEVFVVTVAVGT